MSASPPRGKEAIKQPSDEVVQTEFEKILQDIDCTAKKASRLNQKNFQQKWEFVLGNWAADDAGPSPEHYANILLNEFTLKNVNSVNTYLQTCKISRIKLFIQCDGVLIIIQKLQAFTDLISSSNLTQNQLALFNSTLNCLRSVANVSVGRDYISEHTEYIPCLLFLILPNNPESVEKILNVLLCYLFTENFAIICLQRIDNLIRDPNKGWAIFTYLLRSNPSASLKQAIFAFIKGVLIGLTNDAQSHVEFVSKLHANGVIAALRDTGEQVQLVESLEEDMQFLRLVFPQQVMNPFNLESVVSFVRKEMKKKDQISIFLQFADLFQHFPDQSDPIIGYVRRLLFIYRQLLSQGRQDDFDEAIYFALNGFDAPTVQMHPLLEKLYKQFGYLDSDTLKNVPLPSVKDTKEEENEESIETMKSSISALNEEISGLKSHCANLLNETETERKKCSVLTAEAEAEKKKSIILMTESENQKKSFAVVISESEKFKRQIEKLEAEKRSRERKPRKLSEPKSFEYIGDINEILSQPQTVITNQQNEGLPPPPPPPPPGDGSLPPPPPPPPGDGSLPPPPPPPPGDGSLPPPPPPPPPPGDGSLPPPPPPPPPPGDGSLPPPPPPPPPPGDGSLPPPPPPPPPPGDGSLPLPPPPPPPPGDGSLPPPPPPPPGDGSLPPPPPPPPPGPGGVPPPPPGPAPVAGLPPKANPAPSIKMKPLFWSKLNDRSAFCTFWKSVDDTKIDIDISELGEIFGAAAPPPKKEVPAADTAAATPAAPPKPKTIDIIDANRARTLSIMLARFKISFKEIATSIRQVHNIFTDDQLSAISSNLPTPEEIAQVTGYPGDQALFGNPEKYILELSTVDHVELHVELLQLGRTFKDKVNDIKNPVFSVYKAMSEIHSSERLKRVMQTILKIGNVMNGGTSRGAAYGFKIDLLSKLGDIRGKLPGVTMLHFLIEHLLDHDPEAANFSEELSHLAPASKVDLDFLKGEFSNFMTKINKMKAHLKASERLVLEGDLYNPKFTEFYKDASTELDMLKKLFENADNEYKEALAYFGEDPAAYKLADFATLFLDFMSSFNATKKEILKKRENQKKEMEKKEKKEKSKKTTVTNIKSSLQDSSETQRGVLDGVLKRLQEIAPPVAKADEESEDEDDSKTKAASPVRSARSARIQQLLKSTRE